MGVAPAISPTPPRNRTATAAIANGSPVASTQEAYAENVVREEGKWSAIIKQLNLKTAE